MLKILHLSKVIIMTFLKRIQNIKAFLMMGYIVLFIIDSFFHIKLWTNMLVYVTVILFLISFCEVKGFNKYLSLILIVSGVYLLVSNNVPLASWGQALVKNTGLTALILAVPLLSIIFYLEDFNSHIYSFARKRINSGFSFYMLTLFITNSFAMILNLASLPMVNKLLEDIKKKYPEEVYYKALTRGFCLGQLWAPNFICIAVTLQYSGMEWHSYAPLGFLLFAAGTVLSILMGKMDTKKHEYEAVDETVIEKDETKEGNFKGILKVTGISVILIMFVVGIQYFSGKSILVVVPSVSIIFPAALALLFGKTEVYKERFKFYFNTSLPRMNNEIILFTAVGFFGEVLNVSGVGKYIPIIIKITGISNPHVLIPFIIILIFILAMIGFHPIITISTISIAYHAGAIPISQLQMAAVFAMGYFSYALLSPFSSVILAALSLVRKNPLDLGVRINLIFNLLFIFISSVIISLYK